MGADKLTNSLWRDACKLWETEFRTVLRPGFNRDDNDAVRGMPLAWARNFAPARANPYTHESTAYRLLRDAHKARDAHRGLDAHRGFGTASRF